MLVYHTPFGSVVAESFRWYNASMVKRELLAASDDELIQEIRRLQYLFRHQEIIRQGLARVEPFQTQSVSEHIYNMLVLAEYFLPLEDPDAKLDQLKIHQMILWHDIGEIEAGDIPVYEKNDTQTEIESRMVETAAAKTPLSLAGSIVDTVRQYEKRESTEAQFVYALDKCEPVFELFNEKGKEKSKNALGMKSASFDYLVELITAASVEFPALHRIVTVMIQAMDKKDYCID